MSFKHIKPFSGNESESINEFLYRWRHICRLNGFQHDDELNMLPLLLKGPALTVLRSLNRAQQESPDEILNALVRRIEPDSLKQSKKVQLYVFKMKKEESLEDFIEELLSKARQN